jgi:hypothetical protein
MGASAGNVHPEAQKTKLYVGTEIIRACPETKEGVEGYKVIYPDGYVSWSPKGEFEDYYREISQTWN